MTRNKDDSADTGASPSSSTPWRKALPYLKNTLTIAFLGLVAWLLFEHARDIDWLEVREVLLAYSWVDIGLGMFLALATYTAYASYDLFGRYYTKHGLAKTRTMIIAFVCCAFTLNLGAMIGSVGFRYRMYSQQGVGKGSIARIVGILITTNWLGYIFLAGLVFVTGSVVVPFDWAITNFGLRLLGGAFIAVVVAYFAVCHFSPKRTWEFRGQSFTLPSTTIAIAQLAVSCAHWMLMAGIMYSFLYDEIDYFPLLGVLLISAIAGVLAHVPGALGVLEAVFIALLGGQVAPSTLVAALLAYRAVFYLMPLALAVIIYIVIEMAEKKRQLT